ncbi:LON peptidase substrate-binding domain-containing protein [Shigella flexneri]
MVIPLFVGRENPFAVWKRPWSRIRKFLLVAQKDASTDEPTVEAIFSVGTVALFTDAQAADGTVKVLVEGSSARVSAVSTMATLFCEGGVSVAGD